MPCAVPENSHTPTTEEIRISWGGGGGGGGFVKPQILKKCMKLNKLEFSAGWVGGGGS